MTNRSDIEFLIRKFVENRASEAEIELLQEYFKTSIGLKLLENVIDEHSSDFGKSDLTEPFHQSQEFVAAKQGRGRYLQFPDYVRRAVAAALVGILLLAGVYVYISQNSLTIYRTVAGQKTSITLPDNTIVTLNGNSSLSYRGDWKVQKVRSVDLSGEAYFKVTSNPDVPFVVNTSGILIKVLGTTFNVKSYDNDESVETTLLEGKVVIEKATSESSVGQPVELFPDQKATFSKNSKEIILKAVDSKSEASWVNGSLIFKDEPFSEIMKDLERWYGVTIKVQDKASLQCRFNARIEGESLKEVLKLFSLSGNATYHFLDDKQVRIEGSLCDQTK